MLNYAKPDLTDLEAMTQLYRVYLNDGAGIDDYLREGLTEKDYAGAKCEDGKKLVGVFTARRGVEFTCDHLELVDEITRRWGTEGMYTADMLTVLPEYRGEGIARQLAKNLRSDLVAQGARHLVIEEWHRANEGDVPVSGVLKYFGTVTQLGFFPGFYDRMHEFGMTCPECGAICKCGAYVCVIDLFGESVV